MNDKILTTLEYDAVKGLLEPYLVSAAGKRELKALVPQTDLTTIQAWLLETTDGADLLRVESGIPIPTLADISPQLKRLKVDASLNGTELAQIMQVLRTSMRVQTFFEQLEDQKLTLRTLDQLVGQIVTIPDVTKRLIRSLEADGRLKDEASTKLHGVRQLISQTEVEIRQALEHYTRGKQAKKLSDPITTIRNDRYVIPVLAQYRNQFGGVVHDQSASGQTLYIEPGSVVELNNRLRQAQIEKVQEIRRVLIDLSDLIRPYQSEISQNETILGHLDLINAKAKLAAQMKASLPIVNDQLVVNLRQARHPLIPDGKVVANDIQLGQDYQALVITGPNTGGKTITLKTLGIIQLMAQSGMFIPANENSQVTVFDNVFADIGDEQSLEQNLSTFSGHMENVKMILEQMTDHSLILLDELGAGTDPKEGAALAMAILDAIGTCGARVMVTTHYPELKVYAYDREKTINASMEFDQETLQPTYRLLIGIPGQSNGIAIAKRLGLDNGIIQTAQSLVHADSQDLNQMIGDLIEQRKLAREENARLTKLREENEVKTAELTQKLERFDKQRERLYIEARSKANHEVANAKKQADKIIHHLRQLQVQQGANVKEHELINAKGQLNALHQDNPKLAHNSVLRRAKAKQELKPGDTVQVKPYGQQGTLVAKRGRHQWEVQLGILKMAIDEDDLTKVNAGQIKSETPKVRKRPVRTIQTRQTSARLDLRGKRYEQAMSELDSFIDHALLNNLTSATIVHGKGTGALRKGTQEYLRSNPRVKSFEFATPNNGGDGATIAFF